MNVDEDDNGGFSKFNKNPVIKYAPLSQYYNIYSNEQLTVQIVAKWIEERIDLRKLWCVDKALEELNRLDCTNPNDEELKNLLKQALKEHRLTASKYSFYYNFFTFVILAAFKTAETILHRLADTATRELKRRFIYAWTRLQQNSNGTVSHDFIHDVWQVPETYINKVENEAQQYMKTNMVRKFAPYFKSFSSEHTEQNRSVEDMIISDTMRDDYELNDVYTPVEYDASPCSVHDGIKLRSDCVICKAVLPEEDRPVIISKAFMNKINVTEELLRIYYEKWYKKDSSDEGGSDTENEDEDDNDEDNIADNGEEEEGFDDAEDDGGDDNNNDFEV